MNYKRFYLTKLGRLLLCLCLITGVQQVSAQVVNNPQNSGPGTLRDLIAQATPGSTITFGFSNGTIHLDEEIILDKDLTIDGEDNNIVLSGQNQNRIFRILQGNITIRNLTLAEGFARGGNGGGGSLPGGGGAGLGGAILALEGIINLENLIFDHNQAIGGDSGYQFSEEYAAGGGGGIDGLDGEDGDSIVGGKGGGLFGGEGGFNCEWDGTNGGFGSGGGGGASNGSTSICGGSGGGNGGFGGGGGGEGSDYYEYKPGRGGFGGGGGSGLVYQNDYTPQKGAYGGRFGGRGNEYKAGGGAGLGGAIFTYRAKLSLNDVFFSNNIAMGGSGAENGQGKGAAVFIYDEAEATYAFLGFENNNSSNNATHAALATGFNDNENVYGTLQEVLPPVNQTIVTNTLDGPTGSLRAALQSASSGMTVMFDLPEGSVINLETEIIINKNINIDGGDKNIIISTQGRDRIFFIQKGQVKIKNLTLQDGLAKGGNSYGGGGGGGGLGGAIFIEDGQVEISQISFVNNVALGGNSRGFIDGGGGGMGEDGSPGAGGDRYRRSDKFGAGGANGGADFDRLIPYAGSNGGFGGGGGCGGYAAYYGQAGNGGFGGGGGAGINGRAGAFAGSPEDVGDGLIVGGAGAGLGGAIFIKAGRLHLTDVSFQGNKAAGGKTTDSFYTISESAYGQGKGGAIFIMDEALVTINNFNFSGNNAGNNENNASIVLDAPNDNEDVYGVFKSEISLLAIDKLLLINTETDEVIGEITEGKTLVLPKHLAQLSIQAVPKYTGIGSVELSLEGQHINTSKVENIAPFALFGDQAKGTDFNGRTIFSGFYTVSAAAFSEASKQGNAGEPLTFNFELRHPLEVYLIDAQKDEVITQITDGLALDIPALDSKELSIQVIAPESTGSIQFNLVGGLQVNQIENIAPYALFGDASTGEASKRDFNGQIFPESTYTLNVARFSDKDAQGTESLFAQINFELKNALTVQKIWLIDANQNTPITELQEGSSITVPNLGETPLGIVAETSEDVESVEFSLQGPVIQSRKENSPPYALFGDGSNGTDIFGQIFSAGNYTLQVQGFAEDKLQGESGTLRTITFQLGTNQELTLFPNTSQGLVHIKNPDAQALNWQLMDQFGKTLETGQITGEAFSLDISNHKNGLYLIQVQTSEGVYTKKVMLRK